jgi:hypothetical protein
MYSTGAEIRVIVDGTEIYQDIIEFQPQWIATNLEVSLNDLPINIEYIELQVENSDGILKSVVIYGTKAPQSVDPIFYILAGIMVAIPVIVVIGLIQTGRIKYSRE